MRGSQLFLYSRCVTRAPLKTMLNVGSSARNDEIDGQFDWQHGTTIVTGRFGVQPRKKTPTSSG